jgi:hypothetical protein
MRLPNWLCDLLPYLYASAGMAIIWYFKIPIEFVSGFLLLVTAYFVWMMVRDSWQERMANKRQRSRYSGILKMCGDRARRLFP